MTGFSDYVAFHASSQPGRLAIVDLASERSWTYADFERDVAACARVLTERYGCAPGDRVAVLARNRAEVLVLHLACARTGAIFVPLNWRLSGLEISVIIADAQPRIAFRDVGLPDLDGNGVDIDELATQIRTTAPLPVTSCDPERPSLILYTSGTSGQAKGVVLNERNLEQTAINFGILGRVTRDSAFLVDSPMFHIIGLITSVRPALLHGATVLISDGFQPARTLARMADPRLRVTHYFCVPQMAASLRREPGFDARALRGLTALFTGGAPHPAPDIRAWLRDGIPVVDGYGMSEAGTVFGMPVDLALIERKAGCVGFGTPAIRARIVDALERDCAADEPGELLLCGPNVFGGYWRRPVESAAAFTGDGWFRTGDIAVRDSDGYFRLVDRKKDMYISGGENVYPVEVEAALSGFPGLVECAVVAVPDEQWGEVGVCLLVVAAGAQVNEMQLTRYLRERIAHYKIPKRYVYVERLPRTGSGKVRKSDLRALLSHGPRPEPD